jgi:PAS domain S-box-containing protein
MILDNSDERTKMARKNTFKVIGAVLIIVFLANLNALVDWVFHPEIPYFHKEHLVVGGITGAAMILLFISLAFYTRYLNKAMKRNAHLDKDRQRVIAEMKLTLSELETIYNSAPVGLCVFDSQLRFMRINERMAELNGFEISEHIGRTARDLLPGLADKSYALRDRVIESGKPILGIEITGETPAQPGVERTWLETWIPLKDESGKVVRINVMAVEITEQKKLNQKLIKARNELEEKVKERTAELQQAIKHLEEENQERIRTEQALRLEGARLDALLHLSRLSEASLKEVSSFTLEQAIALTNSKIGFLGLLNADESVYTLHAVSKDIVKECNIADDPLQWHVVDAGIWANAIRERKTLFVNDYSKPHPQKKGLPPGHPYVERFMVVPILEKERTVAVAGVGNKASAYDTSDERQIVLLLSGMWGYVQKNRSREELLEAYNQLEDKVKQRTAELAASNAMLQESQKDLEHAQGVGQIGSWRLDVRRNILTWSEENYRIFGVPKGTALTYETFLKFVHPEDRRQVENQWEMSLHGEPYDIEHRIVVSGEVRWVREKAYLEFDDTGTLLGGFGICQDITELKHSQEALRQSNQELNEYAYALTHNLRAPFRAVQNYANFLTEDVADILEGEPKQYLEGIKKAVSQANNQFKDLEALYRIKEYPVDAESFEMKEFLKEIESIFKTGPGLKLDIVDHWPVFRCEKFLLRQILVDLIDNGFKYNRADKKMVEVGWHQATDNSFEIFVRDNGIGIEPKYHAQIFQIFKRLHGESEYGGTGIGLAIASRAAQKIGATLRVESAIGKGSTFFVRLPNSMITNHYR